jgi:hypothetical protein
MRAISIVSLLSISLSVLGQNSKNWTRLDQLNNIPFVPEKEIKGHYFIIPSALFSIYEKPLVMSNSDNKEIYAVSGVVT